MKPLVLLLSFFVSNAFAQDAPNIIFIYTDDQAPWAIGKSGNPQAITPNMDALAAQGMYFPNAYTTTPVCSPSRAGLLTSRYGYELGIDDWINTMFPSLTELEPKLGLDSSLPTWTKALQQHGYYTGLIGKWHLGYQPEHHPTHFGYHEFQGFISGGTTPINPKIEINGKPKQFEGLTADVLTDLAIGFVTKHQDKRFALSLHYRAPHTNWLPVAEKDHLPIDINNIELPHPDYPELNTKRAKRMMKEYLSSVRSIDRNLGVFLQKLDELNLTKNTLVIFTSDHGYNMGHNGIWHKGNGHWLLNQAPKTNSGSANIPANQRPNMYDNSLKVPLIVRWPNQIPAGSTNLSSFSNLDWYPTILSVANITMNNEQTLRGRDQTAAFAKPDYITSSDFYAAYTTKHQSVSGMRMYSEGHYKLIKDYINKGRDEFYDLINDPEETTNLILTTKPSLQQKIASLDDIIYQKMLDTNDPLLKQFFGKKKGNWAYTQKAPDFTGKTEALFSTKLKNGHRILERENWNVWGMSPIVGDDGKYHVFFSRWRGDHSRWLSHSEIAHAVAEHPEGPYTDLGTVLHGRGGDYWDADTIHNPTIQKVGNQYALFYIGNNLAKANDYDGHHASTQRIGLAISDSLYGPFKRVQDQPILDVSGDKTQWDSYLTTNPALYQHANGEYWLYYKSWDKYNDGLRKMGVAISNHIQGPYRKHNANPLVSFGHLGKEVEDAYVFDFKGKMQMIMRDMGVFHPHVGLLLESEDGITWSEPMIGYKPNTFYNKEAGIKRFERPQILTQNGEPTHLFLALMGGKANTSSGFVIPIEE